jgi:hypothetical protein
MMIDLQDPSISVTDFAGIISAISIMYQDCDVDIPYFLALANSLTDKQMKQMANRSFSVNKIHPSEHLFNAFAYFVGPGLAQQAGIDPPKLLRFLSELRRSYNDVPYHNWLHSIDVAQFCYGVVINCKLTDFLDGIEVFALLLSAICHDTDHDGFNNTFQRNAKTVFCHLAPGMAPLEHHHSCISLILADKLFQDLSPGARDKVSHFMIDCIMATDMERHKQFLEAFREMQACGFDRANPGHRLILAQIILKAADLSNCTRDFDEARRMSENLVRECFRQGDREIEMGLTVSPMCDRRVGTPMCVGQAGFYRFVAGPLVDALCSFFPGLDNVRRQVSENLGLWEDEQKKFEEQNV